MSRWIGGGGGEGGHQAQAQAGAGGAKDLPCVRLVRVRPRNLREVKGGGSVKQELRLGRLARGRPLHDQVRDRPDNMPRPARRRHRPMPPTMSGGRPWPLAPTRRRPLELDRASERVYALG